MNNIPENSNELVRCSRAGDAFHYRWAARRCLKMILPKSGIEYITIEGSSDNNSAGEYSIDVAEYYSGEESKTIYYQLKHSVKRVGKEYQLSDLKETFSGFSKKYIYLKKNGDHKSAQFSIVTNRPLHHGFQEKLERLRKQELPDKQFLKTITKYTSLTNEELFDFCERLTITDTEKDYLNQHIQLSQDLKSLCFDNAYLTYVDVLIEFIAKKALPEDQKRIYPEDVLKKLGFSDKDDFQPAPSSLELPQRFFFRECYSQVIDEICRSNKPVIVHAAGGVGKSVFARALQCNPPKNSLVIVYDCFAMGEYRRRSQHRHGYRDFITQVINELASLGLCDYVLPSTISNEKLLLRNFLITLQMTLLKLHSDKHNKDAQIILVIDAADNAELAAQEISESSFPHELILENYPEHCHLVMTCRTERCKLVDPNKNAYYIELPSFTEAESGVNLSKAFNEVSTMQIKEFHRLTNRNPRVQEQVIATHPDNLQMLLESLGPDGTSVDDQLYTVYKAFLEEHPQVDYIKQIDECCYGIVALPPHVPISVLAQAASVPTALISSLITQFKGAIWCNETHLHFRDETTETWFRQQFSLNADIAATFLSKLQSFSSDSVYIAEAIPSLLLQCNKYNELIELAISDQSLPYTDSAYRRRIRLYRATFAFKAAIIRERYEDAVKMAAICGEESSSNNRQTELLRENIDLSNLLIESGFIEELAFEKKVHAEWYGSENVYSAAMLSNIELYHGEAYAFLRSAGRWLQQYFEELKKDTDNDINSRKFKQDDVFVFVYTIRNLFGIKKAIEYISTWNHAAQFNIFRKLATFLIDFNYFEETHTIISTGNNQSLLALNLELSKIGRFIPEEKIALLLNKLDENEFASHSHDYSTVEEDHYFAAIIAVVEAAVHYNISEIKITRYIEKVFPQCADIGFSGEFRDYNRRQFMQVAAIQTYFGARDYYIDQSWIPIRYREKANGDNRDKSECVSIMKCLLPWYSARIKLISNSRSDVEELIRIASDESLSTRKARYGSHDIVLSEISDVVANTLGFIDCEIVDLSLSCLEKSSEILDNMKIPSKLKLLRAAARHDRLFSIFTIVEKQILSYLASNSDETAIVAESWVSLVKATIAVSYEDAKIYLDKVLAYISRFGDELPQRWQSIATIAEKASEDRISDDVLAYRFIRCAEFTGENVYREKYWNRRAAMQLCTRLSPGQGLATSNRWRDRGIGTFDDHILNVIIVCLEKGYLDESSAWSMAPFIHDSDFFALGYECIKRSKSKCLRQTILNSMIRISETLKIRILNWAEIRVDMQCDGEEVSRLIKTGDEIDKRFEVIEENYAQKRQNNESLGESGFAAKRPEVELQIKAHMAQLNAESVNTIIVNYQSSGGYHALCKEFWACFVTNIPLRDIAPFLISLSEIEKIDFHDLVELARAIPQEWRTRPSFQDSWPKMLRKYALCHSENILYWFPERRVWYSNDLQDTEKNELIAGALLGLKNASINSAEGYFDFICIAATVLTIAEAKAALLFMLERMETNVEYSFGDGVWKKSLYSPKCGTEGVASFIWASLGSVDVETRWDAVHALIYASESNRSEILDYVIKISNYDTVESFIPSCVPFYKYSAQQYLLIALARIAISRPQMVERHQSYILQYIECKHAHAMLQRLAVRVIKILYAMMPNILDNERLIALEECCKSHFTVLPPARGEEKTELNITLPNNQDFYFDIDFHKYSMSDLEYLFNMSEETIKKRVRQEIRSINEFNDGGYNDEPRYDYFFSYNRRDRSVPGTIIPKYERYGYYLAYHGMFFAATSLLKEWPLHQRWSFDDSVDPWEEWMASLDTARNDGYLLTDFRSSIPEDVFQWTAYQKNENWETSIKRDEFSKVIQLASDETCIDGYWKYISRGSDIYQETVSVSSALVSDATSQALINALLSFEDPYDYKLPDYKEDRHEYYEGMFQLEGWISETHLDHEIGTHDFWAGGITCPDRCIGAKHAKLLELEQDNCGITWRSVVDNTIVARNISWSEEDPVSREPAQILGHRLVATSDFLKKLCEKNAMSLVIKVCITREKFEPYSDRYGRDYEQQKPFHHVFSFTSEEGLKNATEC